MVGEVRTKACVVEGNGRVRVCGLLERRFENGRSLLDGCVERGREEKGKWVEGDVRAARREERGGSDGRLLAG